jgi:hypothetical protein
LLLQIISIKNALILVVKDIFVLGCGEGGIRTLDTLLKYTHFPGVLFRPLRHLSIYVVISSITRSPPITFLTGSAKVIKKASRQTGTLHELNLYKTKTILHAHYAYRGV